MIRGERPHFRTCAPNIQKIGLSFGLCAMTLWGVAHTAHVFFTTTLGFALIRIPMAFGEAAMFPASLKAISEWFPRTERAFAIGILTGNRNMGVMLAATGFAIPPVAWLYFGLAQFPIYLLPVILKWLARRMAENR